MRSTKNGFLIAAAAAGAFLPACAGMSESGKRTVGAVVGAGVGAVAGRAIGGKKHRTAGTIIGAVVGGVAGYMIAGEFGANATAEERAKPEFREAEADFRAGESARQSGDNGAAISHYGAASAKSPGQPEPYNNAGLIYLQQGDRANAEAMFRKALEVDPGFEPAKSNLKNMGASV